MNDVTKAKTITAEQAAKTLAECKASPADILFVDERPQKLQEQVAKGASGKEIAAAVGVPASVASCAAVAYGIESPSTVSKLKGWVSEIMNSAAAAKDGVTQAVSDLSIKPYQGSTTVDRYNAVRTPDSKI